MKRLLIALATALTFTSCQQTAVNDAIVVDVQFSESLLFEGSNTLQKPLQGGLQLWADQINVSHQNIKKVEVTRVQVEMGAESAAISESLLLQVVSNNQSIKSIGTLSPIPVSNAPELSLPENTDILPYLNDEGCTWILDVNLSADHEDDLVVKATANLRITYIP